MATMYLHIYLIYCQVQPVKCRYPPASDRQRVMKLLLKWSLVSLETRSSRHAYATEFMLSNASYTQDVTFENRKLVCM